ncbi:hypothetical protein SynPROS71_00912 [Synechococcus sp. PROS-7-1]|nr:hypothetical protein SynPROS71_00912 [Synechococcus sp. PROS-7-1]
MLLILFVHGRGHSLSGCSHRIVFWLLSGFDLRSNLMSPSPP